MRKVWVLILIVIAGAGKQSFAQLTILHHFTGNPDGYLPYGDVYFDGTFLYGMTAAGGSNDSGIIFKIKPDGTGYLKLLDFTGTLNGGNPYGCFISDGIYLYSTTAWGGTNNCGTVFKIKPDGTGFVKLHDFTCDTNGCSVRSSLYYDGTFLYGHTEACGSYWDGILYKIKTDGTGFQKLLDFNQDTTGSNPYSILISDGTFLYGTTADGGASTNCPSGCGTIYKIKTDGSGYVKLWDFDGVLSGREPIGGLVSDGTYLYGLTRRGGTMDVGTIFKIKTDGTGFVKLFDFTGPATGSEPWASLIIDGSYLYGMTNSGGVNNSGVIFRIKTDGSGYLKLYQFNYATDGSSPYSSLISDGTSLYGMTSHGGINNMGTIFKLDISTSMDELKLPSTTFISPNPFLNTLNVNSIHISTITLYDYTGKEILRTKSNAEETVLNTEGIAAGFYLLRVEGVADSPGRGGGVRNYKVVKAE
jgi:uncharacterized repeat protein (TIGR03803 family)